MQFLETARTLAMVVVTLLPGHCVHAQVNDPRTPALQDEWEPRCSGDPRLW